MRSVRQSIDGVTLLTSRDTTTTTMALVDTLRVQSISAPSMVTSPAPEPVDASEQRADARGGTQIVGILVQIALLDIVFVLLLHLNCFFDFFAGDIAHLLSSPVIFFVSESPHTWRKIDRRRRK